jgi:hypothetical protein
MAMQLTTMKCLFIMRNFHNVRKYLIFKNEPYLKSVLHSLLSSVPFGHDATIGNFVSNLLQGRSHNVILGRAVIFVNCGNIFWCNNSHVLCIFTISINTFKTMLSCLPYVQYSFHHVHSLLFDNAAKTIESPMKYTHRYVQEYIKQVRKCPQPRTTSIGRSLYD